MLLRVNSFEVSWRFWDAICLLANSAVTFYSSFTLLVARATFHELYFNGKMAVQGSYGIGGVAEGKVGCAGFTTSAHSLSIKIDRQKSSLSSPCPHFRLRLFPQRESFFFYNKT
jgi:hypothetical protein